MSLEDVRRLRRPLAVYQYLVVMGIKSVQVAALLLRWLVRNPWKKVQHPICDHCRRRHHDDSIENHGK